MASDASQPFRTAARLATKIAALAKENTRRVRTAKAVTPCPADRAQADPGPLLGAFLRCQRRSGNAAHHICRQRGQRGGVHAAVL